MWEYFTKLFDTSDYPARWNCGTWSPFDGWLLIGSDLAIFGAYSAIPLSIAFYVLAKRREVVFPKLYWLFAAFILSCGITHLLDATIFWQPTYRLSGLVKFITAGVSWATVIVLVRSLGPALSLPGTARLNADLRREIDEHRIAQDALRESSERLNLVLQHAKLGDWCWHPSTDEIEFSPRGCEIFGLPEGSRPSWTDLRQLLHEDDQERARLAVENAIVGHEDYFIEYRVTRANDAVPIWVYAKARAQYDASGTVTRMLGIVEDITARKRAEAEREHLLASEQAARTEAELANRTKDEFLATLSHELRTPLNAILGWSHLLKSESHDAQLTAGLGVIERNTLAQAQLVEDLLDMNRIITGKIRLDVQLVDLSKVIEAAIEAVRPSAEARSIRLVVLLDPLPGPVRGDPARLQQVIGNLLTNAIKFTPPGGRIEVALERVNSHVEISVSDNGEGIAPEILPHIFDRFRQADASTTRPHGGLGLGLSIARNLVEMHGGTVHAKSAGLAQGSTFRVALPMPPTRTSSSKLPADDAHPRAPESSDSGGLPSARLLAGSRILLVDDDADSLVAIQRVLENHGATIAACQSAKDALTRIHQEPWDTIVSDIGMPGTDGYALIAAIRALPGPASQVPAVVLSALSRSEDRRRAMLAGFDTFVSKPVEPAELVAVLARCVSRGSGTAPAGS